MLTKNYLNEKNNRSVKKIDKQTTKKPKTAVSFAISLLMGKLSVRHYKQEDMER